MGKEIDMSNTATFGYARTSTTSQTASLDEQRLRLLDAGCTEVFIEEKSGKSAANRPQLQAMLAKIRPGDVVIATKIDRIARSTQDFLQLEALISERGATLKFLDQPIDTSTPAGQLLVTILASFGEFERSMIVERVNQGLERAKREGKQLGRPRKDHSADPKVQGLITLVQSGQSVTSAAKAVGVSRATANRWLKAAA
jgi:DNA invertase Pin-like site-specific DNA recombinase